MLVEFPVSMLMRLGTVAGFDAVQASGAGEDVAARKSTVLRSHRSRLLCRRAGWGLARLHFWRLWVCFEGTEGRLVG